MVEPSRSYLILMVDDDPEDSLLVREALGETGYRHQLRFLYNGEELLDYLHRRGKYVDQQSSPRPDLILLDLKMPKMEGKEVIRQLKSDPLLKRIPIVVLTTSTAQDDICSAYQTGVNSYVTKPVTFRELVDIMKGLGKYWFEVVKLPPAE